jgi:hypothetical protein
MGMPAHLKSGDGFLRLGDHRLLARNLRQVIGQGIEQLGVLRGFAQPHVDHHLVQARRGHGILQLEFLHQRGFDLLFEAYSQASWFLAPRLGFLPLFRLGFRSFRLFWWFRHFSTSFLSRFRETGT